MNRPARVLVTNVEERAALAACRALSAARYTVVGAASARAAAGLHSRSCTDRLVLPDPRSDPSGFVASLDVVVESSRIDALLPGTDAALVAMLENGDGLAARSIPGSPSPAALERALDKLVLGEAAEAVGLSTPITVACASAEEAAEAAEELGFPLLVKPRRSVTGDPRQRRQTTAAVVVRREQLAAAVLAAGGPCLLQRQERGSIYSCGGVLADGRLLGFAFSRYLRTWPPAIGSAAYSETLEPPAELEERVLALVTRIGWEGIFEVELIGRRRPLHVIDFNPRPYGSMALALRAGVNLPALWCDWLLARDPAPLRARPGYHYRWEEADARYFAWQLARGNLSQAAAVLRPRPRTAHAFFSSSDPLPALVEASRVPRRLLARRCSAAGPAPRPIREPAK